MPNKAMDTAKLASGATSGAPRSEVETQGHIGVLSGGQERIQWSAVKRGQAQSVRGLSEGDGLGALGGRRWTSDTAAGSPRKAPMTIGMSGRVGSPPFVDEEVVPGRHAGGASCLSVAANRVDPANPGNDGKHIWACTPSRSMSARRGFDVVAAREQLIEPHRIEAEVLRVLPATA